MFLISCIFIEFLYIIYISFFLQAISDTFTHHSTPQQSKPGCPEAAMLRGLYSLLGEGGTRFPALVLDSGPEQTQTKNNSPAGPTSPTSDLLGP